MGPLPIIAFAKTRWNSLWMNRQHLLSRLAARGHAVAYSNGTRHYADNVSAACPIMPNEHLATGKPVFSTDIKGAARECRGVLEVSCTFAESGRPSARALGAPLDRAACDTRSNDRARRANQMELVLTAMVG